MNLSFRQQKIPPEEKPIQIVLASQSIGRKMLLEKLGIPFRTLVSHVDEDTIVDKDPIKTIVKRATAKIDDVTKNLRAYLLPMEGRVLIITADSMGILGTKTYGKAPDKDASRAQLKDLMGKTHVYVTSVKAVLLMNGVVTKQWAETVKTKVTMRKMTPTEVDSYIGRYDFARFAAAYAINEMPWDLITKIEGSYTNVIGLPFEVILPILRKLEIIP